MAGLVLTMSAYRMALEDLLVVDSPAIQREAELGLANGSFDFF